MIKLGLNLEDAARKLSGKENWHPWLFESTVNGVICTGAVCPLITRGPRKGEPNFRKADKSTQSMVHVPFTEIDPNA